MTTSPSNAVQPDPGDTQAAIDRYRELAKYLITIFAAVGGLLVAGTQLSSLGKLSISATPGRVAAVGVGLTIAIGVVAYIVSEALKLLAPIELSLEDVIANAALEREVDKRPSMLAGARSVRALPNIVNNPTLTDDERALWAKVITEVVGFAAYREARKAFDDMWKHMLVAAVVGVAAIAAFAWGANPPQSATAEPTVQPTPVLVTFKLTSNGQTALSEALGGAHCTSGVIRALSIGGSQGRPLVATIPASPCKAAQFVLDPEWGVAMSAITAPNG